MPRPAGSVSGLSNAGSAGIQAHWALLCPGSGRNIIVSTGPPNASVFRLFPADEITPLHVECVHSSQIGSYLAVNNVIRNSDNCTTAARFGPVLVPRCTRRVIARCGSASTLRKIVCRLWARPLRAPAAGALCHAAVAAWVIDNVASPANNPRRLSCCLVQPPTAGVVHAPRPLLLSIAWLFRGRRLPCLMEFSLL